MSFQHKPIRFNLIHIVRLSALLIYVLLTIFWTMPIMKAGARDLRLLLRQGQQLLTEKKFQAANERFSTYVSYCPGDPHGYFWLGKVNDDLGQWQTAIDYYAKSLMLAKKAGMDSEELRVNLGNTALKLHYLDQAIFDYQRAIEINDKNMLAHFNLSKTFLLKGQYEQSLQELSRCSQLGLIDNSLNLWRAIALKGLGRLDESRKEAKEYWENASPQDSPDLKTIASQLAGL